MKKHLYISIVVIFFILLIVIVWQVYFIKGCQNLIQNVLYEDFRAFRFEHDLHYPVDIAAIENFHAPDRKVLDFVTCPGVGMRRLTTDAVTNADYIYINWEPLFGTNTAPGNYPILYDRRLANHKGLGVNVVTMNGRCFFDFRGRWLKNFSLKYPQYQVTLPK
jgi:hypothetical protein